MPSQRFACSMFLWACALFAVHVQPAFAAEAVPPACHANVAADVTYTDIAKRPELWNCRSDDWSIRLSRSFLRIDLASVEASSPLELTTRLTRFDRMRLTIIGTDGRMVSREVTQDEVEPATFDWLMHMPLPRFDGQAGELVIEVDNPRQMEILSDARVLPVSQSDKATIRNELLLALLGGILCVPLLFDIGFYRVLRERFLLWHALAVGCMLVQTFVTSGLINRFVSLSIETLSIVSSFSWGGGIAAAALLLRSLMEPGKLARWHESLILATPVWIFAWTAFYLFADGSLRPFATPLYYMAWIPVLGLFIWILAIAKWHGSRAVNFQIAAWTPIMVTGSVRVASALGATDAPLSLMMEQHISIGLEALITWLGVADRFMIIMKDRDRAKLAQKLLEARAYRDPLTGLFNRRFIEERFAELHAQGFQTMAVIDLDRFKRINDTYGHAMGDDVLRATAEALAPDDDTLIVRMGGEEFMLLLRGHDAVERAERRRLAISARVVGDVPGLDRIVTASMGVVEFRGSGKFDSDFTRLFTHCDRLLYEAKAAGRNRTQRERVQAFAGNPRLLSKYSMKARV